MIAFDASADDVGSPMPRWLRSRLADGMEPIAFAFREREAVVLFREGVYHGVRQYENRRGCPSHVYSVQWGDPASAIYRFKAWSEGMDFSANVNG